MKAIIPTNKTLVAPEMIFNEKLGSPIQYPHHDPIVLTLKVGQMNVRRVLVDTGTTADLVTKDCLRQLKYETHHLQPLDRPLVGFGGSRVAPMGTIVLPVRLGKKGNGRSIPVRFTVIDIKFPYNVIMGIPLINKVKAVISTHQLFIQYEKENGTIGILRGDQKVAKECQINTLKMGNSCQENILGHVNQEEILGENYMEIE
jgi:hypothetical protein